MSRTRTNLAATAALLACTAGLLVGCGDDDSTAEAEGTTATTAAHAGDDGDSPGGGEQAGVAEFCTAYTEITAMMGGEPDPEAIAANIEVITASAPAEVADQVGVMTGAVETFLDSGGEDYGVLESPEFAEAQGEVDPFVFENCEFDGTVEVVGRDYSFEGIPETLAAGNQAWLFTNEGSEAHEIVVFRRLEGVTDPFEELLALPEEEAMSKVAFVGATFGASNGSQGLLIGDFEPGDYIAICFVPVGTTSIDGEMTEGTGEPHFMHGMQQEFTVS